MVIDATGGGMGAHCGARLKHASITEALREQIATGALAPGMRLPTQVELIDTFGVSGLTVQRSVDTLVAEEFVRTDGRRGTFVVDHPPHLSRYGLIFPTHPGAYWTPWNRFWGTLVSEAAALEKQGPHSLPIFYDTECHDDNESYQELLAETRSQRLAGLIFAFTPKLFARSPLLLDPNLPRVAIMGETPEMEGVSTISPTPSMFTDRALDYLADRGKRRVAILTVPAADTQEAREYFASGLAARGMSMQPYWRQALTPGNGEAAFNIVHLLLTPQQAPDGQLERPDALIVTDDNLLEHALGGLLASGARAPDDVEVVAHCNFPATTPAVVPVKRLGYDTRHTLRTCMEIIDRQRQGEPVPGHTIVPALFDDELEPDHTPSAARTPQFHPAYA